MGSLDEKGGGGEMHVARQDRDTAEDVGSVSLSASTVAGRRVLSDAYIFFG